MSDRCVTHRVTLARQSACVWHHHAELFYCDVSACFAQPVTQNIHTVACTVGMCKSCACRVKVTRCLGIVLQPVG